MDDNFIEYFIAEFKAFDSYDQAVHFGFGKLLDMPDVERLRYGNNNRYCVFLNRKHQMAVLAQCTRYESK